MGLLFSSAFVFCFWVFLVLSFCLLKWEVRQGTPPIKFHQFTRVKNRNAKCQNVLCIYLSKRAQFHVVITDVPNETTSKSNNASFLIVSRTGDQILPSTRLRLLSKPTFKTSLKAIVVTVVNNIITGCILQTKLNLGLMCFWTAKVKVVRVHCWTASVYEQEKDMVAVGCLGNVGKGENRMMSAMF